VLISPTHWPIQIHFEVSSAQNILRYGQPNEANTQTQAHTHTHKHTHLYI